ncbi:hypothetical protein HCZ30_02885 [Marivivens donghaensis]|uniref:Flagellin C-terminal domain-containing protein n=1 Tax=Marivivens donghaensis TaxID=1699413 RepID=A0ABX0VTN5_9RHOB|nr:flagellin [Marivivens donghaensis]NIY71376.1 hypothetical protein [Marivivens donghaensis]
MNSIGDLARSFVSQRHNTLMRQEMNVLTQEITTGEARDVARKAGNTAPELVAINSLLKISEAYASGAQQTGQFLSTVQTALEHLEAERSTVAVSLIAINANSTAQDVTLAADHAKAAFGSIVNTLNTQFSGQSLFAGTAQGAAFEDPATIIESAKLAISVAINPAGAIAALDAWFDDPAGFAAVYLGATGPHTTRKVDAGVEVTISARADDQGIKDMLKGALLGALAPELGFDHAGTASLMQSGGATLLDAGSGLAALRGQTGLAEERTSQSIAFLEAQRASLTIARNDIVSVDPFETATKLTDLQTRLEMHYTLTARLAGLTLSRFI